MTITAVFGVDDFTTANIEGFEAADGCDIEAGGGVAVLDIVENIDQCSIVCGLLGAMDLVERGDNCLLTGLVAGVVPQPVPFNRYFVEIMGEDYVIKVKEEPIIVGVEE